MTKEIDKGKVQRTSVFRLSPGDGRQASGARLPCHDTAINEVMVDPVWLMLNSDSDH